MTFLIRYKYSLNTCFFFVLFLQSGLLFSQFPGGVKGVGFWLKADSNNTSSLEYKDYSISDRSVNTESQESRPTYTLFNYNPSFQFDGSKQYLSFNYLMELLNRMNLYTVYKSKGTDESALYTTDHSGEKYMRYSTKNIFRYSGDAFEYGKEGLDTLATFSMYTKFDGPSNRVTQVSGNTGISNVYLGKDIQSKGWSYFKGLLPEMFIYDRLLTNNEQQRINSYLSIKYGLSVPYSEYLSSRSDVIWKSEDYLGYPRRVTGIGRDDYSGLFQKQSTNIEEDKRLIIALGDLASTNLENTSELFDQSFLVWADNGEDFSLGKEDTGTQLLLRKWKVRLSTPIKQSMSTSVHFQIKDILQEIPVGKRLCMFINRSGEDAFDQNSDIVELSEINDKGEAVFKDVKFDKDLSGTDVFTLALADPVIVFSKVNHASCTRLSGDLTLTMKGGTSPYKAVLSNDKNYSNRQVSNTSEIFFDAIPPGKYQLELSDAVDFKKIYPIEIEGPDEISLDLATEKEIGPEGYVVLDASKSITNKNTRYQWSSDNGFSSRRGKVLIYDPGVYQVKVTTSEGCVINRQITVIADVKNLKDIVLYPNPTEANSEYTIRLRLKEVQDVSVQLYDIPGRLISTKTYRGESTYTIKDRISTRGVYIVQVITGSERKTFKLIIN